MSRAAKHTGAVVPDAYPHVGGCEGCRADHVCNFCGRPFADESLATSRGRCTNGRCLSCHASHCTAGGVDGPGHGYDYGVTV